MKRSIFLLICSALACASAGCEKEPDLYVTFEREEGSDATARLQVCLPTDYSICSVVSMVFEQIEGSLTSKTYGIFIDDDTRQFDVRAQDIDLGVDLACARASLGAKVTIVLDPTVSATCERDSDCAECVRP